MITLKKFRSMTKEMPKDAVLGIVIRDAQGGEEFWAFDENDLACITGIKDTTAKLTFNTIVLGTLKGDLHD